MISAFPLIFPNLSKKYVKNCFYFKKKGGDIKAETVRGDLKNNDRTGNIYKKNERKKIMQTLLAVNKKHQHLLAFIFIKIDLACQKKKHITAFCFELGRCNKAKWLRLSKPFFKLQLKIIIKKKQICCNIGDRIVC